MQHHRHFVRKQAILEQSQLGGVIFLYISPKILVDSKDPLRNALVLAHASGNLSRFVMDEASCVEHNVPRKVYTPRRLAQYFPGVKYLAATATAIPSTQREVIQLLNMQNSIVYKSEDSFRRALHLEVVSKSDTEFESSAQQVLKSIKRDGAR